MACSVIQKGSSTSIETRSLTPQLFGYFSKAISESPYHLHPEFMRLKKHLVCFPFRNVFCCKTCPLPDYCGNNSSSYLSSSLLEPAGTNFSDVPIGKQDHSSNLSHIHRKFSVSMSFNRNWKLQHAADKQTPLRQTRRLNFLDLQTAHKLWFTT